ncbi:MAG: hypothetical protein LBU88_08835 [Treponema sp.]|nr:hypothetical protein [Treponema sp.]
MFQEVDIKILQDLTTHYFKYKSERFGEFSRIITIEQYKNNVLLKEMQFTLTFYEYYIECPELINSEFAQRIKLIDLAHKDLVFKVRNAYILDNLNVIDMSENIRLNEETLYFLQKLYEETELGDGIFSNIIIENFDFGRINNTDYSKIYIEIFQNNNIILNEIEKEILYRKLYYVILNYK